VLGRYFADPEFCCNLYTHPVWQQEPSLLQCTGTLELAALGPTMLIFNLFTYIFTAITITTVRYATSLGFLVQIVAHVVA